MNIKTGTVKVLVLESQARWRKHARNVLRGHFFDVVFALTTEQAASAINRQKPDVLVVGDCVPSSGNAIGEDLVAFVKTIRREFPNLPMVAISSNCNFGDILKKAGCISHTIRSHLADELRELLKSCPI